MALKKIGQAGNTNMTSTNDDRTTTQKGGTSPVPPSNDLESAKAAIDELPEEIRDHVNAVDLLSPNMIDSAEEYKGEPLHNNDTPSDMQVGMSVHDEKFYKKQQSFIGGSEVISNKEQKQNAAWHEKTDAEKVKILHKELAKPATQQDLTRLDESMIMALPQIKAATFELNSFLNPKFKDKTLRGRWANSKNFVAGNLHRFLSLGFQIASVDDIESDIDSSLVNGTTMQYHDVILLKINVIRLMELYKSGVMKAYDRLENATQKGLSEANRQFASSLSETPGASKAYNDYAQATGKAPVTFELVNQ